MSLPISVDVIKVIPSSINILTRLSIIDFSNLKSGIPYLNKPPIFSSRSYTTTLCPAKFNCCAAAKPAGPEPTTAIFFPVFSLAYLL